MTLIKVGCNLKPKAVLDVRSDAHAISRNFSSLNICGAIFLGPAWSVGVAFCASVKRNLTGLGSLMAVTGSMVGALCCGLMYKFSKKIIPTCIAEALGTGILGGLAA